MRVQRPTPPPRRATIRDTAEPPPHQGQRGLYIRKDKQPWLT